MKNPKNWNRKEIDEHLQQALDLELWTIPLYLSALYSIKGLNQLRQKDFPNAAKLIISVVVQEMLHLELVCNISNALGYSPKFKAPIYDPALGIPFIHPELNHLPEELRGFRVEVNNLNSNSLKLFAAIEFPHLEANYNWETKEQYLSIAEFYAALRTAIDHHWDDMYVGHENNKKQKKTFSEYGGSHGFSQTVHSRENADMAIEAIIEQGEGAHADHVPEDFQPHIPKNVEEHASWFHGDWSHYDKFNYLIHHPEMVPEVYKENEEKDHPELQEKLSNYFNRVLLEMEHGFNSEGEQMSESFWSVMTGLGHIIGELWESGQRPKF
jgi:hypothetical protein